MKYISYSPVLTNEYFEGKPLTINHGPQLLVGDTIIEDAYRIWQVEETPVRYSEKPIMCPDAPWELFINCPTILKDPEDGLFKMWYSTRCLNPEYEPGWETNLEAGNCNKMICYAESEDGIHWVRPELDIYPFGQWKTNNIVFAESTVGNALGTVIINPDKSNPDHRFIMFWNEGFGVRISFSPDGKHWSDRRDVIPISMDCSLVVAYDESRSMWQLFTRPAVPAKHDRMPSEPVFPNRNYRRRICVMESPDLVNWSMPRVIYRPDQNNVCTEADNITFFTVNNYPLGFIHLFSARTIDECTNQYMLPHLAFGRDVYHLNTLPNPKPVLSFGEPGAFDDSMVNIYGVPVKVFDDDRTYFYYCGVCKGHQETLGLLSFEDNRYCACTSDEYGGWVVTREFILDGSDIEIDANISEGGSIRVEIVDGMGGKRRDGRTYDGFSLEACEPLTGDSHRHVLKWNGSSDVSALKGKAVYLRFHVVSAKLYSFTVNE